MIEEEEGECQRLALERATSHKLCWVDGMECSSSRVSGVRSVRSGVDVVLLQYDSKPTPTSLHATEPRRHRCSITAVLCRETIMRMTTTSRQSNHSHTFTLEPTRNRSLTQLTTSLLLYSHSSTHILLSRTAAAAHVTPCLLPPCLPRTVTRTVTVTPMAPLLRLPRLSLSR